MVRPPLPPRQTAYRLAGLAALAALLIGLTAALRPGPLAHVGSRAQAATMSATSRSARALPPSTAAGPRPPPGVTTSPYQGRYAYRLRIPALGIDAGVEAVGTDGHGHVGVPSNIWDAAWYRLGPAPGEPGDAVIDGHLDWYTGPALFQNLSRLRPGDIVEVVDGAANLTFRVSTVRSFAYTSPPPGFLASAGPPRLSLVTCGGEWNGSAATYSRRLVVDALLV